VLFAEDGSGQNPHELDFYECRFNRAFRLFRIDFLRSESARTKPLESLPAQDEIGLSADDEEKEPVSRLPEALRSGPTQLQSASYSELMNAVNGLPTDERKAIILCRVLGLKEESNDPGETTASKLCGVTPRTIRNRLFPTCCEERG
jgi:DNA-directed RNA polymerase specialized sigma24 family protein